MTDMGNKFCKVISGHRARITMETWCVYSAPQTQRSVQRKKNYPPLTSYGVGDEYLELEPSAEPARPKDNLVGKKSCRHQEQAPMDEDNPHRNEIYQEDDGLSVDDVHSRATAGEARVTAGAKVNESIVILQTSAVGKVWHNADTAVENTAAMPGHDSIFRSSISDARRRESGDRSLQQSFASSISHGEFIADIQDTSEWSDIDTVVEDAADLQVYDNIRGGIGTISDSRRGKSTDRSLYPTQSSFATSVSNGEVVADTQGTMDLIETEGQSLVLRDTNSPPSKTVDQPALNSVQGDDVPVSAGAADVALSVGATSVVAESTPAIASVEPQTTINSAYNDMTAAKRRDCLTVDGLCHLLDAVESEIKCSSTRKPFHCYIEDSSPLPAGVYREIIELSNGGRALSAVSITRLCAAVVNDLPRLCSSPPTGALLSDRALINLLRLANDSQLTEHDVREQANVGSVAVWDRLYAHLTFLISHGTASVEQLTDVFAPLLISYDSQLYNPHCVNQAKTVLSRLLEAVHVTADESLESSSDFSFVSSPRKPQTAELPVTQSGDVTAARTAENMRTVDEDDADNLSTNSNPPAPALLPTTTLRQTTAYQQLLNTTGSSFSLTALSTGELESDDDIEKDVLPKRPGPASSPRQTAAAAAAAAAAAPKDSREIPKKPAISSPAINVPSDSARNAPNKEGKAAGPMSSTAAVGLRSSRDNIVFKVNADPNLDDEDIVIPTANMSGSGGHRVPRTAGDDDNDDDDGFDDF